MSEEPIAEKDAGLIARVLGRIFPPRPVVVRTVTGGLTRYRAELARQRRGSELARLRAVAEAADEGGRAWEWHGGYPQQVIRQGDVMIVAETYEGPDFPSTIAEFIATFDPPTVLRLIDAATNVLPPGGGA